MSLSLSRLSCPLNNLLEKLEQQAKDCGFDKLVNCTYLTLVPQRMSRTSGPKQFCPDRPIFVLLPRLSY